MLAHVCELGLGVRDLGQEPFEVRFAEILGERVEDVVVARLDKPAHAIELPQAPVQRARRALVERGP